MGLLAVLAVASAVVPSGPDLRADAEIFQKAALWAERFGPDPAKAAPLIETMRRRWQERLRAVAAGRTTWTTLKGRVARGYVSPVDGSVQPYGVIVPSGYDPARPIRLDVVLHGSTAPGVGTSEADWIKRFDRGDEPGPETKAPMTDYIELHPLGRVETGYRYAGEADVFDAIEDVARKYNIDRDRIVMRGMSMGASGTWHLGLKNPDRFVALGPYCGYVDTHRFSETPRASFVKVGPLPWYQEKTLHMLDSADWAANAGIVPAIAAIGDKDVFWEAHVIMGKAMAAEGLEMVNLVSHGTGHTIDPATEGEQLRRIGEYARRGQDHKPVRLRFVTWTLRYSRAHWVEVLGLGEHYARAEIDARLADDGAIDVRAPTNITRFALLPPAWGAGNHVNVHVGGSAIDLPALVENGGGAVIERVGSGWRYAGPRSSAKLAGKRPGLQGPIDDAFTSPFLCVRGTGKPWNPAVAAWAEANLRRFANEWARYFRGDLPVKDDADVTDEDVRDKNLILFGDPGSNRFIARVLPRLPLRWTRRELRVGGERFASATHAPALVNPNPLQQAGRHGRYVVLNSGHTFHDKELGKLNYLLFPRLGDFAVLKMGGPGGEEVVRAGLCDESWRVPPQSGLK